MVRGEKPIELGNSWFSAKTILVEHFLNNLGSTALDMILKVLLGGLITLSMVSNLEKP
jgi:hypothetical protein